MENFTPISALIGGALIGLAASAFLLLHGKIAGISGLFATALRPGDEGRGIDPFFLLGLLLAGLLARFLHAPTLPAATPSLLVGALAGALVGVGTRVGSGCTSGHGVCGLARLSKRSLVATLTFMATGVITVTVLRVLGVVS
jgi:uncharacterized membrane protein YedE/YeeE